MLAGGFLRIEEISVHDHLEDAASRRYEGDIRDLFFELLQNPLRQTDGSRRIPSLSAVFNRNIHMESLFWPKGTNWRSPWDQY
jgi:hypothetical protein